MRLYNLVAIVYSTALIITSGYASDFKTFKIIPSDAVHDSKLRYISNYHGESEAHLQEYKNNIEAEAVPEHRSANLPINLLRNHQDDIFDVKNINFNQNDPSNSKLSLPYPYAYNANLDSPKALQISVEPHKNDTKFKINDSFLDSYLNSQPQSKRTPTTKGPKKPNQNQSIKRPISNQQSRPNKNIKQGIDKMDEMPETTNEPVSTHHQGSVIQHNDLTGTSQIGNRESQMVLKPTVIVNIRGTVTNSEGELSLESRSGDIEMSTDPKSKTPGRNIFHISQEINIDRKPSDDVNNEEFVERKGPPERETVLEERTFQLTRSNEPDESHLTEKMSIFDDYGDFSLYR